MKLQRFQVPAISAFAQVLIAGALLMASLSAVAGSPSAQDPASLERARSLFETVEEHETAQQWREALGVLNEIAKIRRSPTVAFHQAFCLEQLGRWTEAEAAYRAALDIANGEANRDVAHRAQSALDALEEKTSLVHYHFRGEVTGLRIDDVPVATTAASVRLLPGTHRFETASQRGTLLISVSLLPGEVTSVELTGPTSPTPVSQPLPAWRERLPWVLALVSGAAAGGGVASFLVASSVRDQCENPGPCNGAEDTRATALTGLAIGLWATAGVAAGAAGYFFLADPDATAAPQ